MRRSLFALLLPSLLAACESNPAALPANLLPTLSSVDFGRRVVDAAPTLRAINIQNTGGQASSPLGATIIGTGRAGFRIDNASSSCLGARLAPASSCVVAVLLEGQASGPLTATLLVGGTGDEEQKVGVNLTGTLVSLLNVYYQGAGHGSVSESAHGGSCVAVCTFELDVPTVTLTAVPDPQSAFAGWVGVPGCDTGTTCTLTLIDLNAVTVKFDPI